MCHPHTFPDDSLDGWTCTQRCKGGRAEVRGSDRDVGEDVADHPLLLVRKSVIYRISWSSRWKWVESFSAKMCGCSLVVVLGCSRCLCTVSVMNVLASFAPLPARYGNRKGSIRGSVTEIMRFLMILSIAFITRGVRATGLTIGECFHGRGS